ncbi:hypothetical protein [Thermococcus sp. 2319x1]|uniref:hypothetical protein n=1 Tax=Thermococcus sp. 2319x1 TaxID=1674923 RepID=UPI0015816F38|nr:hypothetical protein [Thermococcus sp. 2319x1]
MKIDDVFEIVSGLKPAVVKKTANGRCIIKEEGGRKLLYEGSNGTEVIIVRTDCICDGDFRVVLKSRGKKNLHQLMYVFSLIYI